MSDTSAKQQIVDKVKNSTNILVTVSSNPSVDELSAALGLSLLLNKMKKHATAVFSGDIPPAINFLDPEKTFENTVDSLRDFIIALDKEKADHLRYKVEGDVVKIFITPYKTTITSDDLDFSQGDYNVELVLALGVTNQANLDKALEAHGKILNDATVVTMMAGGGKSDLGSIGWQDASASSLSEMIVGLAQVLKADKSLIDQQIATAFLAGIVSATERFSNNRTSAKVMTMAAELMAAGANQQLIASKFEEADSEAEAATQKSAPQEPVAKGVERAEKDKNTPQVEVTPEAPSEELRNQDGTTNLSEGESTKVNREDSALVEQETNPEEAAPAEEDTAGTLNISHEKSGTLEEVSQQTHEEEQAAATQAAQAELARQAEAAAALQPNESESTAAEQELSDQLPKVAPVSTDLSPADLQKDIQAASSEVEAAAESTQLQGAVSSDAWQKGEEPSFGGTLNATSHAAAEEARRAEADARNKTILSHETGYMPDTTPPPYTAPLNAASQPAEEPTMVNPLHEASENATFLAAPIQPLDPMLDTPQEQSTPELPPLPDFSTLPPLPPAPPVPGVSAEGGAAMPAENLGDILPPAENLQPTPASEDPGQFRIPGQ